MVNFCTVIIVTTQEQLQQKITLTSQAHGQEREVTCQSPDTRLCMHQYHN